jgi:hypothetical protein
MNTPLEKSEEANELQIKISNVRYVSSFCCSRVSDPYSFDPDPDPAFEAGDQSGSGSNSDPGL